MNFKKTKVEVVKQKNPFPNMKVGSDAAIVYSPFIVKQNKGAGPKGQTSNAQIKKVPFKGVKQYTALVKKEVCMNLLRDLVDHLKEWSDWKMKDWIKAGIVAIIVIIIIGAIQNFYVAVISETPTRCGHRRC